MAEASYAGASSRDVQNALDEYRKTLLDSNQASLRWYVGRLEASQPPESMDDEKVNDRKLRVLKDYLGMMQLPDFIHRPGDALESMDRLTRLVGLDGVLDDTATEGRDARVTNYLDAINRGLSEHADDEFQGRLSVPAEFTTLMQHADSVVGAGLPFYRERHQIAFFDGFTFPNDEEIEETVLQLEGDNDLEVNVDDDWEVAAGWKTGSGQPGDCYALYCRSEDKDLDWAWRYHVDARDATHFEPTSNLASFLRLYARYEEPIERDLQQMEGNPFA